MFPIIATAVVKAAETSAWWYLFYGAGASASGYYGWCLYTSGFKHQRKEMSKDTPMNKDTRHIRAISAQLTHDIKNQGLMADASKKIVQDMKDDEVEIDSIVDAVESQQKEMKILQEYFQAILGKILYLTGQYDERHQSITAELIELNKIFSKDEMGQLQNIYRLIEQNSALSTEIEKYKSLVVKLAKVINVLKEDVIVAHQLPLKSESSQAQLSI